MNVFKFGCNHVYGDIKDQYQYCIKCNKAIPVEPKKCDHVWKNIDKYEHCEDYNYLQEKVKGIIYVLRCNKCGDIKKEKITA